MPFARNWNMLLLALCLKYILGQSFITIDNLNCSLQGQKESIINNVMGKLQWTTIQVEFLKLDH